MLATMYTPAQNEPPISAADRATALATSVAAMLRLAQALVAARRDIDLAGLEQDTGRLCAAVLDLPHAQGRALRPTLAAVLAELDMLAKAVATQQDHEP
jgi:DNA-binding MurR/RpiR family transcriptional regulator